MAQVRPFRGLRYTAQAGNLTDLVAPPFDVISPQEQEALHSRNPHNIVRVELGETRPSDSETDNRYTRAAGLLQDWIKTGVLRREDQPAMYLCRHDFRHSGRSYIRWELLVQVKLEPWENRVVLPHEHTLPEAKTDRLNLVRATRTNVSPVYCLYRDDSGELDALLKAQAKNAPKAEVPQWREEGFAFWSLTDPAAVAAVQTHLDGQRIYIADGHHRYETALNYQRESGADHLMIALTSLSDPGLLVLPLHRLVRRVSDGQLEALLQGIAHEWVTSRMPVSELARLLSVRSPRRFVVYGLEPGKLVVITPRDRTALLEGIPVDWAEPLRQLDLSLLHSVIIHGYLGIGKEPKEIEDALGFAHEAEEAVRQVDSGAYQLAVFVNPTAVEEMVAVAQAGEKMPQKSTFFYPKLPTGLVLNPLDGP